MAIFDADRPLRVAVLFSGGASGFRYLRAEDPNFGEAYEVVCAVASDPDAPGIGALEAAGVPVVIRDIRAYYDERDADPPDMAVRRAFDEGTADRLADHAPDCCVLSGYMWVLTEPLLDAYPVVNVHPADLTVVEDGERVYTGADPVHDAILAGEAATRSSVHLVTAAVDAGPVLVLSRSHEIHRELVETLQAFDADAALRAYADAHQAWMKWTGDGPALAAALERIATGKVAVEDGRALVDGEPGPLVLD